MGEKKKDKGKKWKSKKKEERREGRNDGKIYHWRREDDGQETINKGE